VKWIDRCGHGLHGRGFLFSVMAMRRQTLWMLFAGIILHGVASILFCNWTNLHRQKPPSIYKAAARHDHHGYYGIGYVDRTLLSGFIKDKYTVIEYR